MDSNLNNDLNNDTNATEPVAETTVTTDTATETAATITPAEDITSEDIAPEDTPVTVVKTKKEHRILKKVLGCIGLAACFGLVAGGTFCGVKYAVSRFFPEETVQGAAASEKRANPLAAGIGEWLRNRPVDCFNEPARSEGVGGVLSLLTHIEWARH